MAYRPRRLSPAPDSGAAIAGLTVFAPAKINLYLHVGAIDGGGYHLLNSLMTFADVGDAITLRPARAMSFAVEGPFAAGLAREGENLVTRAREALLAAAPRADSRFALILHKALPIASGIGGGSADAAAALRLIRRALDLSVTPEQLLRIAASLGADVPACVDSTPVIATGRGERLAPAPPMPVLDAVLVNPGVPVSTAAVFRAYDGAAPSAGANAAAWPERLATPGDVAVFLAGCRNDLEDPAVGLQPRIGAVLETLRAQPETLLARMSGSGATCFALCADAEVAAVLATRLERQGRDWWIRACRLGSIEG